MNSDERILQILENSACLSKGQLLGYLRNSLYPEELRAVELHLSTCALCSDALEGLELQQDAEKLLSELGPPALPALQPREKPKEKKETPAAHEEKAAALTPKSSAAGKNSLPGSESNTTLAFRPRRSWARPIGIAAAVLLAFGALWYFEFSKEDKPKDLAMQGQAPETRPPGTAIADSVAAPAAAAPTVHKKDSLALLAAERKHKDSVLLAKREAARLLAQKDTVQAGTLAAKKTGKPVAEGEIQAMAARSEAAQPKESTAVADNGVASKKAAMAAPAASKAKEDSKEKPRELSDFELGLQKYKEKNYASALLYFRSAESDKKDPRHWEAVYYSALCNKNLDKKRKAIKLFEKVIDANAPQKKAAQKQLDELKKSDE